MPRAGSVPTDAVAAQWSPEVGLVVVDPQLLLVRVASTVLFLGLVYSLASAHQVHEQGMQAFAIPDRVAATMLFGMGLLAAAILLSDIGVLLIHPRLFLVKVASIIMFLGLAHSLLSFNRIHERGKEVFAIPNRVAATMLFGMVLLGVGIVL